MFKNSISFVINILEHYNGISVVSFILILDNIKPITPYELILLIKLTIKTLNIMLFYRNLYNYKFNPL